jgi:hypothetical protein
MINENKYLLYLRFDNNIKMELKNEDYEIDSFPACFCSYADNAE